MACISSWLQPNHARLPTLYRRPTLPSILSRLNHSYAVDRVFRAANESKLPMAVSPLQAVAKRGFSLKEDEVASRKFTGKSSENVPRQFEAPLEIVKYPDPRLRAKNKRINAFDDNLKKLVEEMFDVMYKTDGIGLSAPQVGINVQLMVFNPAGEREEIVLVNPRVSKYSKKLTLFNEGCLSFPKIYGDVQRPESVKIDARDASGTRFSVNLSGLPARVFQHEFDHLQGILFFERMTEEVLDEIRGQLEALEKTYEDKTGLPSPEKIENHKGKKVVAGFGKK